MTKYQKFNFINFIVLFFVSFFINSCDGNGRISELNNINEKQVEDSEVLEGTRFKGYQLVFQMLKERIALKGEDFQLANKYLRSPTDFSNDKLETLLGAYVETGSTSNFVNGDPNSINMLIWYILFHGLSEDIASSCLNNNIIHMNQVFEASLQSLCSWPQIENLDEKLTQYWLILMGYEAPLQELVPWQEYVHEMIKNNVSAQDGLRELTKSILLNPYFLLKN